MSETMKLQPCPACGGSAGGTGHRGDYPVCQSCWFSAKPADWNRLSLALSLIEDITVHVDSPLWSHELTPDGDGDLFVGCQGQDVLRAMLADYREATK